MSLDAAQHTRGESVFIDDITEPSGLLFGALFTSPIAHGKLRGIDTRAATAAADVVRIFTSTSFLPVPRRNSPAPGRDRAELN